MPIKIYKTQAFNQIFLCFEAKHKKHKTKTQILGLHACHKPRNQHQNTTLPQTQKSTYTTNPQTHINKTQPTNPPLEYISPPRSTPLSWEIERWKSHLGLSLSGNEIMRLESLGSFRLHNHWSGLQYRISDWGFVQRSHTKSVTMVSYWIGGPSRWVFSLLSLERVRRQWPHHWDLREFGSERDFVKGEERKRKLEIERV